MSSIFLVLCILHLTVINTSSIMASQLGGYLSSCTSRVDCDSTRNLSCNTTLSQCTCPQQPDHIYVYDNYIKACTLISAQHEGEFWKCDGNGEFYSWNMTKTKSDDHPDLGFCKSDHECQTAHHNSTSLRCDLTRCSCECLPVHPDTSLPLLESGSGICIYGHRKLIVTSEDERGYYKASCSQFNPCNITRNLTCHNMEKRCLCIQRPGSGFVYKFDVKARSCVPVPNRHNEQKMFWKCEDKIRDLETTVEPNPDLGFGLCKSHHECYVNHPLINLRCNFTSCSCECMFQHPDTGLPLINANHTCEYGPIECYDDADCVQEYGKFSECNLNASTCMCESRSQFRQGKCVRERRHNESCYADLECELGIGQNTRCSVEHSICECEEGFALDKRSKCIVKLHSTETETIGHRCYKIPLIVLAIFCAVCLAVLFTLCYLWRPKLSKYNFRRMGTVNRSLELTSSFSTSKDAFDE